MAIICRKFKLLFILTPRTGSSAVATALCHELEGEYLPAQDIVGESGRIAVPRKHTTLAQLERHGLMPPDERRNVFVFTCVRNPFDTLVSFYIKKAITYQPLLDNPNSFVHRIPGYVEDMRWAREHTFDEWIVRRYVPRLRDRFFGRRGGPRSLFSTYVKGVDAVMRFEHLQADLDRVLQQAGVTQRVLVPSFNVTTERGRDYRKYYSDRTRRIVESRFAEDLREYGYEF